MFEAYSERGRQVIFLARFKAGQRGADVIDVDDLLAALIVEDQGMMEKVLSERLGAGVFSTLSLKAHRPFFSPALASDVLERIEDPLPQSQPIAPSVEIPISPELKHTFDVANELLGRLQQSQIEPLHLLAAALTEESSQGALILQQSGITQEKVLEALQGEAKG